MVRLWVISLVAAIAVSALAAAIALGQLTEGQNASHFVNVAKALAATPSGASTPTPTGTPTPTHTATPALASAGTTQGCTVYGQADSDCDGCPDVNELQTATGSEFSGGGRNPHWFWDFFDTPDSNGVRDHKIRIEDVTRVIARYRTNDANGTAAINRNSDALAVPPPTGYHPAFDRGPLVGPHPWDLGPPDGTIDITDVIAVINQYRHDCTFKIQHVVIIMQENRSFDSYFGTFPGADGIPMQGGQPTVCVPDPVTGQCFRPFHDPNDVNQGGPHGDVNASADIDGGRMDGFVAQAGQPDVMGYHDQREIPNYWTYAEQFVLQDHMFEPNASWSLPAHLFMVSAWSAVCSRRSDPMSCASALEAPDGPPDATGAGALTQRPNYAWTDLTYLLHQAHVIWGYYVADGTQPDCYDDSMACTPVPQTAGSPGIWNPLPWFDTVKQDGELGNIQALSHLYDAALRGTLPAVSWIVPNNQFSEHPPNRVSVGQAYVTGLINAIMQGPDWQSTAIFLSWDDWGGFYDHVAPPTIDQNGYGLRVPGLVISAYAKQGFIDHQTLSFDAYLKFIEDIFLGGRRLDPLSDGRPDTRPNVREAVPQLGSLIQDFDFTQAPRPPVILPPTQCVIPFGICSTPPP